MIITRSSTKQKYFEKRSHKQRLHTRTNSIEQQGSQIQLNAEIYSRFQNFMSNQKFKKLKHAMDNYIGRNTPINYHSQFGFQEQWQNKKRFNSTFLKDFLHTHNLYVQILAFIILIGYCVLVWFVSFQLVFQRHGASSMAYVEFLGLVVVMMHVGLKLVLHLKIFPNDYTAEYFLRAFTLDIIVFLYFVCRLAIDANASWVQSVWTLGFDLFVVVHGYRRGALIYKSFKMKVITSIYKDFFNLFDLLATLLIVAHLFALMLYLAGSSQFSGSNWIEEAKIDHQGPKTLYLYSLYFACTTMLTVGYGDLTPSNVIEIITVLMIEIFGIAIFAYVINEIGHTLSSMRKQQETLEKDLSSLSKVSKYYGLDQQLETKARAFIIDNQTSISDLLPQDEKELLMKLNDELRTQINQENSLKIIKSSIFFICHWSKKMQYEVAKKLTKKLYAPNEKLLQISGRQSIYLIKRGKVDIYTDRYSGLRRHFKKLLKTIEVQDEQGVTHNVFGYTAVVSSRPIKLNAITKDFTVVYYLQKNDFIESLMDHELDFQYFHQIKCRIDMQKLPQAYEAPSILNIRQHYRPNVFFVIKKSKKNFQRNKRLEDLRDQARSQKRRMKVHIYECLQQLQGQLDYSPPRPLYSSSNQNMIKTKTITQNAMTFFTQENDIKRSLHLMFDVCKEYDNYFKKFNMRNVLLQLEKENYGEMSVKAKLATMKTLKSFKTKKEINFRFG